MKTTYLNSCTSASKGPGPVPRTAKVMRGNNTTILRKPLYLKPVDPVL